MNERFYYQPSDQDLTPNLSPSTLNNEGNNIMADISTLESAEALSQTSQQREALSSLASYLRDNPHSEITVDPEVISNPEARKLVSEIYAKQAADGPMSNWDIDEIQDNLDRVYALTDRDPDLKSKLEGLRTALFNAQLTKDPESIYRRLNKMTYDSSSEAQKRDRADLYQQEATELSFLPVEKFSRLAITDPALQRIIWPEIDDNNEVSFDAAQRLLPRVEKLIDSKPVPRPNEPESQELQEATQVLDKLKRVIVRGEQKESLARQRARMEEARREYDYREKQALRPVFTKLTEQDWRIIEDPNLGPVVWLEGKLDYFYQSTQAGRELDSPLLQDIIHNFSDVIEKLMKMQAQANLANNVLAANEWGRKVEEFTEIFNARLNNLQMRATIDKRDMQGVQGMAGRLLAHGLLYGYNLDNGMAGWMFNRVDELLDDIRRVDGGLTETVNSEMVSTLVNKVVSEQLAIQGNLARLGMGAYADLYQDIREEIESGKLSEEKFEEVFQHRLKSQLTRAARTAHDLFINTSRQALTVIKGDVENLNHIDTYKTQSIGAFDFLNAEAMLYGKFRILNQQDYDFLLYLQDKMVDAYCDKNNVKGLTPEERFYLGKSLFRDLFVVPDFYSSGWRIDEIIKQVDQVVKNKAYNLALVKNNAIQNELIEYLQSEQRQNIVFTKLLNKIEQIRADIAEGRKKPEDLIEYLALNCITQVTMDKRNEWINKWERSLGIKASNDEWIEFTENLKKNNEFAMYFRLKAASNEGKAEASAAWGNILKYRQEDVLKYFREWVASDISSPDGVKWRDGFVSLFNDSLFVDNLKYGMSSRAKLERAPEEKEEKDGKKKKKYTQQDIKIMEAKFRFDEFRKKYGAVIRLLRDSAMSEAIPRQIDFSDKDNKTGAGVTEKDKKLLFEALGKNEHEANVLLEMYSRFDSFIKSRDRQEASMFLVKDPRFSSELYRRTLSLDDAMLGELEDVKNADLTPISRKLSSETGGDAYQRNMNDYANAKQATTHLLNFLKADPTKKDVEKQIEEAIQFADFASRYGGEPTRANIVFATAVRLLESGKVPLFFDALGMDKLPARTKMTLIEQIRGPHAPTFMRDELRHLVDKYGNALVKQMEPLTPEEMKLPKRELKKLLKKRDHEQKEILHEAERTLGVDWRGASKRRGMSLLLYLLMVIFYESFEIGKASVDPKVMFGDIV